MRKLTENEILQEIFFTKMKNSTDIFNIRENIFPEINLSLEINKFTDFEEKNSSVNDSDIIFLKSITQPDSCSPYTKKDISMDFLMPPTFSTENSTAHTFCIEPMFSMAYATPVMNSEAYLNDEHTNPSHNSRFQDHQSSPKAKNSH